MILCLRDIETFPAHTCLEADPGTLKVEYDGVCSVGRVVVELDIQKSGDEYFCQARVTAETTLECARTLQPFPQTLVESCNFIVCSRQEYERVRAEALDDEDYAFYEGDSLKADLTDIVRQTIILAVPMMPISSEDAPSPPRRDGIRFLRNGERRPDGEIDERWAGLRDLLDT